jgi:SAM-dependent methyltransferase
MKASYLVIYNIWYHARNFSRARGIDTAGQDFDRRLGVETTAIREIGSLDLDASTARFAVRYQPTDVELARRALRHCPMDHSRFVFVDYGCGKGRVLLVAAELPFRKLIGVEFSRELHGVAFSNVEAFRRSRSDCPPMQIIHADASEFEPPEEPLVCYLYNPFGAPVLSRVAERLEQSVQRVPRDLYVIYVDAVHAHVFDESAVWELRGQGNQYRIYAHRTIGS